MSEELKEIIDSSETEKKKTTKKKTAKKTTKKTAKKPTKKAKKTETTKKATESTAKKEIGNNVQEQAKNPEVVFARLKPYEKGRCEVRRWGRQGGLIFQGSNKFTGAMPLWYVIPYWLYEELKDVRENPYNNRSNLIFDFAFTREKVMEIENDDRRRLEKAVVNSKTLEIVVLDEKKITRVKKLTSNKEVLKTLDDIL